MQLKIGDKVQYRIGNGIFTGYVNAIVDSHRVIVGLLVVRISKLTKI